MYYMLGKSTSGHGLSQTRVSLPNKKVHKLNAAFVAEVPIAQKRAKIAPVFGED